MSMGRLIPPTLLALLLGAASAVAQTPTDSTSSEWLLHPARPCVQDGVTLFVRGYLATPCDSFAGAFRAADGAVVIRQVTRAHVDCAVGPSTFFAVPIAFGPLPAGPQSIALHRRFLVMQSDGSVDSTTADSTIAFQVAADCPIPPPPLPADQLPLVDRAGTAPSPPCPDRPTALVLGGYFPNSCGQVVSASSENGVRLVLAPSPPGPIACALHLKPWSASFPLGFLAAGSYRVGVDLTVQGTNVIWPPIFDQHYAGYFAFSVGTSCGSLPPPLPYVKSIRIGPALPDSGGLLCAGRGIRVGLSGVFPNDCFRLRRIDLLDLIVGPAPEPPTLLLTVDDGGCLDRLCRAVPVPWDTSVVLPGLPGRDYLLPVQLARVSCTDSIPPDSLFSTVVPFQVAPAESCGVPSPGCLLISWASGGAGGCDAFLVPGRPVRLDFQVAGGVALSGLQGEFRFREPGLRISALEALGPATGMHLSWTPTAEGARYVMFAERGAPIPASRIAVAVLRVTAEPLAIRAYIPRPADGFHLEAPGALGADAEGREVLLCPTFAYQPAVAHICFERECDFDGNGVADVRDLVRMVHCVNGEGPCPLDPAASFDCDGDGRFGLGDVLCCAIHVLHGPECPECPPDSIRPEPALRASFGVPVRTARGADVPLMLEGAGRIGAARLALGLPTDRFNLVGASLTSGGGEWLVLHEPVVGGASVAVIATGMVAASTTAAGAADRTLDLVLHLDLKPGASAGGEISLEGGEFSGPDGVMLRVDLGAPSQPLGGMAAFSMSPVRPNPSPGVVRFSITLEAPARLDVSVHDLAGRRVAELFHGDQAAGTRDLVWDGRTPDGAPAREGVYFLRAAVGGRAVVKKLVLLRRWAGVAPN